MSLIYEDINSILAMPILNAIKLRRPNILHFQNRNINCSNKFSQDVEGKMKCQEFTIINAQLFLFFNFIISLFFSNVTY